MEAAIKEWQDRAEALKPLNLKQIEGPLGELSDHLTLRTFVVGYEYSTADETLYKTIRGNRVAHAYIKQNLMPNVCRWFRYIEEVYAPQVVVVQDGKKGKDGKVKDDGANYDIGLQDVGDGTGVVTRFPPEPSCVSNSEA
jgi:glutamyl-tRNA synthetase